MAFNNEDFKKALPNDETRKYIRWWTEKCVSAIYEEMTDRYREKIKIEKDSFLYEMDLRISEATQLNQELKDKIILLDVLLKDYSVRIGELKGVPAQSIIDDIRAACKKKNSQAR